jgi:hypothetical protein
MLRSPCRAIPAQWAGTREAAVWSDSRRSRQRAWSRVLPLLLVVGVAVVAVAWRAYTVVD